MKLRPAPALIDGFLDWAGPLRGHCLPCPLVTSPLDELSRRWDTGLLGIGHLRRRLRCWRRRLAWHAATRGARFGKRALDVTFAVLALLALSPLFVLVAALIKLTDGGPVLFWQTRVGRWGQEFPFPKFRSMVVEAEQLKSCLLPQSDRKDGVTFKMRRDPRTTWIGRLLRRFSIDELPQLWNVLTGDMSLVGPRPPVPLEVARYSLRDRQRLEVTPGLTCIWQVSGRADIPFTRQVDLDLHYIENRGLWLDCKLILQTLPAVISGKGAY